MRNLEDCKAEVFRRSEERIKERNRNRNRILVCCIPLCLLLVAGGICIRPLLQPVDERGKAAKETVGEDYAIGGTTLGTIATYVSVEITDRTGSAEVLQECTDTETVGELCRFLTLYFDMPVAKDTGLADGAETYLTTGDMSGASTGTDKATAIGGTVKEETTAGQDRDTIYDDIEIKYDLEEKQADYRFIFRAETGEEFVFFLYGDVLHNEKQDCSVKLSEAQAGELKARMESVTGYGDDE